MKKFYIPHKLTPGDITHLSDSDSELVISEGSLREEDLIQVETTNQVLEAQITFIDKASVEIEVKGLIQEKEKKSKTEITVIQSITFDKRFHYFLEKMTEIGVDRIIPVISEYSQPELKGSRKRVNQWRAIIAKSQDQSRNPSAPVIEKPIMLSDLSKSQLYGTVACLSSEEVNKKNFADLIDKSDSYTIAIGPETGWSSEDLKIFKELGFQFAGLKGNILRTETGALVAATMIKTLKKEL